MAYALVSGGSKGIGYAIAMALAKRKYDLVLVARNKEDLGLAKTRLENQFHIRVVTITADMQQEKSFAGVSSYCVENNIPLQILCNVTGLGGSKDYLSVPLQESIDMLRINTEPAIALTYHLLPLLKKNKPAFIVNVSSMAGLSPIPLKNIYSAAKSALLFFSYSLRTQLRKDGISVSCLCPGPVFTKPSIKQDTIERLGWLGRLMAVPAEQVGETAVRQALIGKRLIIPGRVARLVAMLLRLAPAGLIGFLQKK